MRTKVFISSVINGYADYRDAAKRAVRDLHQEPVMAEDFPALSRSPRTACLDGVRTSDVYVGLFGARFSQATIDEYEEAKRSGKTFLIFVEQVQQEDAQAGFLRKVEDYVSGHFRDSFSCPRELYEKVVKALSGCLVSEKADFEATDRHVLDFGKSLRKEQFDSWLWIILAPVIKGHLLKASEFIEPTFADRVLELTLSNQIRLFDLRMASHTQVKGERLILGQEKKHRDTDLRTVVLQRDGLLVHGSVVADHRESRNSFSSFYIDPDTVKERVITFFAFADQLFQWLDPTDCINGFSMACYLSGTDKHFEKPAPTQQHGMTIPWVTGNFPDPLMIPKSPFNMRKEALNLK